MKRPMKVCSYLKTLKKNNLPLYPSREGFSLQEKPFSVGAALAPCGAKCPTPMLRFSGTGFKIESLCCDVCRSVVRCKGTLKTEIVSEAVRGFCKKALVKEGFTNWKEHGAVSVADVGASSKGLIFGGEV